MARRSARVLGWSAALLVLLALAIAFAPTVAAPLLAARLSDRLGAAVGIGWIAWNPLEGRVVFHELSLAPAAEEPPLATIGAVAIDVSLRRWWRGEWALEEIVLRRPWIALRRTADGDFNVAALLRTPVAAVSAPSPTPTPTPAESPSAAIAPLEIGRLRLVDGSIEFRDETTTPVLETSLYLDDARAEDLALARGTARFAFRIESRLEDQPLVLDVRYRATADGSLLEADLETKGAALERGLVYVPLGWQRVAGRLDARIGYRRETRGAELRVHRLEASARLHDLALGEPWASEPTARAADVSLETVRVDFMKQRTDLGTIRARDFHALIARDRDGVVHVPLTRTETSGPPSGWTTSVETIALERGEVELREVIPGADPSVIATVHGGTIRLDDPVTFRFDGTLAGGTVRLDGEAGDEATVLRLGLGSLALADVSARLRLPVRFAAGTLDGTLRLILDDRPLRLAGSLALAEARTLPSEAEPTDVMAWPRLTVELADSTVAPLRLHLRRLETEWPYVMIHRRPEGVYPLTLFTANGATGEEAGATAPVLRVDTLVVRNGRFEFYDTRLPNAYGIELVHTDATLAGVELMPLTVARVDLTGTFDELSPVTVTGSIRPGDTDLAVSVARLLLEPLNPYLAPMLGYEITSGTASTHTDLTIRGSRLEAGNDLVLSRFGMARVGRDRFEPHLGMPLSIALGLLKDARGDISLELPLHGDLEAQEYRVGSFLREALRDALLGAVRAPIRLLGSVFRRRSPEPFDLKPVPFPPGRSDLAAVGEQRLAEVARLLDRHANLTVVLVPEPSEADVARLRDEELLARLAARAGAGRDGSAAALRDYLEARYAGTRPDPPTPEVAQALRALEAELPSPRPRLVALASARAAVVARSLVERHGIAPPRIGVQRWDDDAPRVGGQPGVDVQLRTQ